MSSNESCRADRASQPPVLRRYDPAMTHELMLAYMISLAIGAAVLYVAVRFAVNHGMQDYDRHKLNVQLIKERQEESGD